MAKHPRGDVNVTIEGVDYVMKPTFGAMAAIQSQTGLGLGEMVKGMALTDPAKLRVDVVASILFYGITGGGKTGPTMDDIGEQVMDEIRDGDKPLVTAATAFLLAYFGKPKAGDEKKPEETTEA